MRVEAAPNGKGAGARPHPVTAELAGRALEQLRDLVAAARRDRGGEGRRPAGALRTAGRRGGLRARPTSAPWPGWRPAAGAPLAARAAVHLGEVLLLRPSPAEVSRGARPLEVEGAAKELAARLGALAGRGQVLLTQGAFDLARPAAEPSTDSQLRIGQEAADGALRWLAHGPNSRSTGWTSRSAIFEVGFAGRAPLAPPADSRLARRLLAPSEERMLGWRPALGQAIPQRPLWTLAERLGEGGFGEVWLARHKAGEQRVFKFCFEADKLRALKREVTLFRLLKEALGHRDDIARILDWQFDEAPFFVESEYTEGGNLAALGGPRTAASAALPLAVRLELAAEVAEALAAAHSVGVLHKDVKPENVLVRRKTGTAGRGPCWPISASAC